MADSASHGASRPIFIVGCQRSGTTLLRLMLDSHGNIACGPETRFLRELEAITGSEWHRLSRFGLPREVWLAKVADFFSAFQQEYAESRGKSRWADKSPLYALLLPYLWELFPDAQVIHVIRDVHDVTSSHRKAFGYKAALNAPRKWSRYVTQARQAATTAGTESYFEVRYEELVGHPELTLRSILDFLGEPWDSSVLHPDEAPHDVNPRYWDRTGARRKALGGAVEPAKIYRSSGKRDLDPLLRVAVAVTSRRMQRELGY